MKKILFVAPCLLLAPLLAVAQQSEKVDLNTIHRIKEETLGRNSKVMDHMFYLTDVNGPRLNNSKGYRAAGEWAVKRLKEYGLSNVHLEKWGPFGKGWNLELYSGHMLEPMYQPIIAHAGGVDSGDEWRGQRESGSGDAADAGGAGWVQRQAGGQDRTDLAEAGSGDGDHAAGRAL